MMMVTVRSDVGSSHRTNARALRYSRAALFAVLAAFAISVLAGSGTDAASGRLGGDFPAFYSAGSIVADGDWGVLYDPDRQLEEQAALFGEPEGNYLYFAYPPHVAPLYRPLAAADYRTAYVIHTLLMAAALLAALVLIRPMVGLVDRHFELVVTASLLFYPMLRAVTGGQNTALSLLGIAAVWRLLRDEQDVAAGLVVALLLYKPQLAVPLIGLLLLSQRWRALAGAVAGGAAVWAFGASVMGTDWIASWWGHVSEFAALDAEVNGHNAVSWLGFTENIFGAGSGASLAVAAPLVAVTVAIVAWAWLTSRLDLGSAMAVTVVGLVLMSPHAMFYDAGLLVLPGVVALDRLGRKAVFPVVGVWLLAWLQVSAAELGFAPLFVCVAVFGVWVMAAIARETKLVTRHLATAP